MALAAKYIRETGPAVYFRPRFFIWINLSRRQLEWNENTNKSRRYLLQSQTNKIARSWFHFQFFHDG